MRTALALKTFAEITRYTDPLIFCQVHFRFAISAQIFFPGFHRSITRNHCHGTKIDAPSAFIAKFGMQIKRGFHAAILAASDKTDCLYPKGTRAQLDTTSAQNAVIVSERISDLLYPATYGNVLDSTGIRSLCNE
jgi:hypothetical protein